MSCHLELSSMEILIPLSVCLFNRTTQKLHVCMTSSRCLFLSVAVELLDSRYFCKNSHHIKGEALIKKRHLEILGYRVVQVRQLHFIL